MSIPKSTHKTYFYKSWTVLHFSTKSTHHTSNPDQHNCCQCVLAPQQCWWTSCLRLPVDSKETNQ